MSRGDLLHLLPDFAEAPSRRQPRAPGFEPLVHDAAQKEDFAPLGMAAGFIGLDQEPEEPTALEPFPGQDDFPDTDAGHDEPDVLSLADIGIDLDDLSDESEEGDPEEPLPEHEDGDFAVKETAGTSEEDHPSDDGVMTPEMLEAAHREEMERLEAAHCEALGQLVNSAIPGMKAEIVTEIADQLAPLLARFIRKTAVDATLEALRGELATVLDDSEVVEFELRGPEALVSAFMQGWPSEGAQVRVMPGDGADLVARVGKSVLSTRLSEFDRLLEEALS